MAEPCLACTVRKADGSPFTPEEIEFAMGLEGVLSVQIIEDNTLEVKCECDTLCCKECAHALAVKFEGCPVHWACQDDPATATEHHD
jgi:hypothetical protein